MGQTIAGLHRYVDGCLHGCQQRLELVAGQRAPGGHHGHMPGQAQAGSGFEGGLHPHDGQRRVVAAQRGNGHGGGGVAGHDQGVQLLGQQPGSHAAGTRQHKRVAALAIRRVATVRHIDKVMPRQFGLQRLQHAQAPNATVKHADAAPAHVVRSLTSVSGQSS